MWLIGKNWEDRPSSLVSRPSSPAPAFTLIEMMVVLVIIALVVGMSLPYFGQFTGNSQLRSATQKISSLLYTARSLAITHRKQYAVVFDTSKGEMTVQELPSSEIIEKRYYLPATVSFENPGGSDPVTFKDDQAVFTPTGGLSGDTSTIDLKDKKGNSAQITVHQSTGRVKVELKK